MPKIDLTRTFDSNMPVYPGDTPAELKNTASLASHGYNDSLVKTGMHVGTHLDAPRHMIADGKLISDISVERFFGQGKLIDARGKKTIDAEFLDTVRVNPQDILLILTGLGAKYKAAAYYNDYSDITEDFAEKLIELQVRMIGIDGPSPDRPPWRVHQILLSQGILILENLTNLETLLPYPEFQIIALPAKFNAGGAPTRVVAIVP